MPPPGWPQTARWRGIGGRERTPSAEAFGFSGRAASAVFRPAARPRWRPSSHLWQGMPASFHGGGSLLPGGSGDPCGGNAHGRRERVAWLQIAVAALIHALGHRRRRVLIALRGLQPGGGTASRGRGQEPTSSIGSIEGFSLSRSIRRDATDALKATSELQRKPHGSSRRTHP